MAGEILLSGKFTFAGSGSVYGWILRWANDWHFLAQVFWAQSKFVFLLWNFHWQRHGLGENLPFNHSISGKHYFIKLWEETCTLYLFLNFNNFNLKQKYYLWYVVILNLLFIETLILNFYNNFFFRIFSNIQFGGFIFSVFVINFCQKHIFFNYKTMYT